MQQLASAPTPFMEAADRLQRPALAVYRRMLLLARRLNLPYAVILVLGGMGIAFIPGLPAITLDPQIALACSFQQEEAVLVD